MVSGPGERAPIGEVRTLFLLRHAKSSWADPALSDYDRPLAPRGTRAATRVASHLRSEGVRPELVLCSSARRARQTPEVLKPAIGDDAKVQVIDDLYGADALDILNLLRSVESEVASVMVLGHNPGLQNLAIELAGAGNEAALAQLKTKFPTAALATLDLGSTGWDGLGPGRTYLASLALP
jgi:phosphohistidine phosphatase